MRTAVITSEELESVTWSSLNRTQAINSGDPVAENRIGLTEGLLIAGIPVVGYWIAYLYELGYCRWFGVPPNLIEVGVLSVLVAISSLLAVCLALWIFGEMVVGPLRLLPRVLASSVLRLLLMLIPFSAYALVSNMELSQFLWVTVPIAVIYLFVEFVFPLLAQRSISGYIAKMEAQRKVDLAYESLLDLVVQRVGFSYFKLYAAIAVLSMLAYGAGGLQARLQTDFMVVPGTPASVGIKTYGTYLIAATWDRSTKMLSREFRLIPMDEQLGTVRFDRVGPLEPESFESKQ